MSPPTRLLQHPSTPVVMTSEQALQLIDQAVAQLNLNRAQHSKLIEAVAVLKEAIKE
jgi:hypothetical protein